MNIKVNYKGTTKLIRIFPQEGLMNWIIQENIKAIIC